MSECRLHDLQVASAAVELDRESMTQAVDGHVPVDPGEIADEAESVLGLLRRQPAFLRTAEDGTAGVAVFRTSRCVYSGDLLLEL
jgi:hypothetical protein